MKDVKNIIAVAIIFALVATSFILLLESQRTSLVFVLDTEDREDLDTNFQLYVNGDLVNEREVSSDYIYAYLFEYKWGFFEFSAKKLDLELISTNESGTNSSTYQLEIHRGQSYIVDMKDSAPI